jgi:hypothetical protein
MRFDLLGKQLVKNYRGGSWQNLEFRFFTMLSHPARPMCVFDHHFQRCARREAKPIISALALGIVCRALADQGDGTTCPISIDAPTTQSRETSAQDLAFASADHSPIVLGLGGNYLFIVCAWRLRESLFRFHPPILQGLNYFNKVA